jgi:hypothetical protein
MSSNTTSRFYVMLMPNDGYLVREEGDDILSTERDALDCWIVEATGKKHALAITLHKLYNALRASDPTAQHARTRRLANMPPIKRPAYPYITAYGRYLGSKQYYIAGTKERATKDNAPNDVVFYRVEDGNRVWTTIDQLPGDLKRIILSYDI